MKRKILISILLVLVSLFATVSPAFAAAGNGICDVDGNGKITAEDARLALRFAVWLDAPTTAQRSRADADGDGTITASDARWILRIAVDLDTPFSAALYGYAHQFNEKTFTEMHSRLTLLEGVLNSVNNWCCYYTVHDVFTPVLKNLGYTQAQIDKVAPTSFSKEKLAKATKNTVKVQIPAWMAATGIDWYIPSLLLDYYLENPQYAQTFVFWDYYDDVVADKIIYKTPNAKTYVPRVGDVVFMSNKESSYVGSYPTIDHTAQIIEVYPDGSFLCTEGCIIENAEPDKRPRVRERIYDFEKSKGTYDFRYNDIVNVVAISRPLLKNI